MSSHLTFTDLLLARHLFFGRVVTEVSNKHAIIRSCRIARSRSTCIWNNKHHNVNGFRTRATTFTDQYRCHECDSLLFTLSKRRQQVAREEVGESIVIFLLYDTEATIVLPSIDSTLFLHTRTWKISNGYLSHDFNFSNKKFELLTTRDKKIYLLLFLLYKIDIYLQDINILDIYGPSSSYPIFR